MNFDLYHVVGILVVSIAEHLPCLVSLPHLTAMRTKTHLILNSKLENLIFKILGRAVKCGVRSESPRGLIFALCYGKNAIISF